MNDNVYERIHRTLTWKRIIAFNLLLFMVTAVPISVRLAQEEADNRSGAAGNEAPVVTPPPSYPKEPPKIDRVSEFFGKKGDAIVILGSNFGDYKWESKVYVGNVEASDKDVVKWSNTVLEVQIPESARTGKVWVAINGKQAEWEGSLLLYDVARAAKIGIKKGTNDKAIVWIANGNQLIKGMVEVSHVSELSAIRAINGRIINQSLTSDSLGKKTKIEFQLNGPLSSPNTDILEIDHPGIGNIELIRVELYDQDNILAPVYADPFSIKVVGG